MTQGSRKPSHEIPLSVDLRIHEVCEQFEAAWRAGSNPRIEDFLSRVPDGFRDVALKELIAQELELRQGRGDRLDIAEYKSRFPHHPHVVSEAWGLLNLSQRTDASEVDTASVAMSDAVGIETADGIAPTEPSDGNTGIPDSIGRYAIRSLLGSGGFGAVFLAHNTRLDRLVALKVPLLTRFASIEAQKQFMREARNAAKLDHPGIVQVYDVQDFERGIYIVQQYIEGHDLSKVSQSRKFSLLEVINRVIKTADPRSQWSYSRSVPSVFPSVTLTGTHPRLIYSNWHGATLLRTRA